MALVDSLVFGFQPVGEVPFVGATDLLMSLSRRLALASPICGVLTMLFHI